MSADARAAARTAADIADPAPAGRDRAAGVLLTLGIAVGLVLSAIPLLPMVSLVPAYVVGGYAITVIGFAVVWFLMSRSVLWRPAGWRPLVPLLWGGFASMIVVVLAGDATTTAVVNVGWEDAEYAFGGAWPEETGKLAGVALVLIWIGLHRIRPWDGLLVGMLVGLGFELVETVQYAAVGAVDDPNTDLAGFLDMWFARGVTGPGLHVFFTGIAGWALGVAMTSASRSPAARIGIAAAGFLAGFLLHFLWNYEWPDAVALPAHVGLWFVAAGLTAWAWIRFARRAAGSSSQRN